MSTFSNLAVPRPDVRPTMPEVEVVAKASWRRFTRQLLPTLDRRKDAPASGVAAPKELLRRA
jgi:hypothetical protein